MADKKSMIFSGCLVSELPTRPRGFFFGKIFTTCKNFIIPFHGNNRLISSQS